MKYHLGIDVSMECKDEARLDSPISGVALFLGGATTLIPVYYVIFLLRYRRIDFTDKKYPDGVVTTLTIGEGEQLGERVSQLDSPSMLKSFGQCDDTASPWLVVPLPGRSSARSSSECGAS